MYRFKYCTIVLDSRILEQNDLIAFLAKKIRVNPYVTVSAIRVFRHDSYRLVYFLLKLDVGFTFLGLMDVLNYTGPIFRIFPVYSDSFKSVRRRFYGCLE